MDVPDLWDGHSHRTAVSFIKRKILYDPRQYLHLSDLYSRILYRHSFKAKESLSVGLQQGKAEYRRRDPFRLCPLLVFYRSLVRDGACCKSPKIISSPKPLKKTRQSANTLSGLSHVLLYGALTLQNPAGRKSVRQ